MCQRGLIALLLLLGPAAACSTPGAAPAASPVASDTPQTADAGPTPEPSPESDAATPRDPQQGLVVGTQACQKDDDCVPARCCHPAECVARASAPACKDVMCTLECRPQTLDCGGRCLCREGRCAAKLNDLGPREQAL